ncbi:hypothetical protein KKF32_01785 [Patescibacteria group bacterium]|nr:hypothetical protein [Patescibacteria group bacterium]
MSIVTFPLIREYSKNLELKNGTKAVIQSLRLAQQSAVTEQFKYAIRFTALADTYYLVKKVDPEEIINSWQLPNSVYFFYIDGLEDDEAVFNSAGAVDFSGDVYLAHLQNQAQTLIEIKPSGYITWQNYEP